MHDDTVIEIEGCNGQWFTIAGPYAGEDSGMWLGTGVKGLFDPAVKTTYETPGNWPGARFLSYRVLPRNITLQIHILNDRYDVWAGRDSELRKAFAFDKDTWFHVTTPESGHRKLAVRLQESPDVDLEVDPHGISLTTVKLTLISGDPFWYEDDLLYFATCKKDTSFQPTIFTNPTWDNLPSEDLKIVVDPSDGKGGLNPTDQIQWLKWTVPGSADPIPGITIDLLDAIKLNLTIPWDQAPYTQFAIPDFSWGQEAPGITQGSDANRIITTPGLIQGEDCLIDTDPRVDQFMSASGSNVWARTNGVRFMYPIPAYTKSCTFPIKATGCKPGDQIGLRVPRYWSRPWGLE